MRLIPRSDGQGRVPAVEVMLCTATIREHIIHPDKTLLIRQAIQEGHIQYGMQTFDQALMKLYKEGFISYEDALTNSTSPDEFSLRVKGIEASSDASWSQFEAETERPRGRGSPQPGPRSFARPAGGGHVPEDTGRESRRDRRARHSMHAASSASRPSQCTPKRTRTRCTSTSRTRTCASVRARGGELPEHSAHHLRGRDHELRRDPSGLRLPLGEREVRGDLHHVRRHVHRAVAGRDPAASAISRSRATR